MAEEAKHIDTNAPQLDENCAQLLDEVQQYFSVRFEEWAEDHCAFQVKKRDENQIATEGSIYYYKNAKCEKIAHELLHAKCEYMWGSDYYELVGNGPSAIYNLIFNKYYWQMFSNHVQHYVMFKEYKRLGYDPLEFFEKLIFPEKDMRKFALKGIKKVNGEYDARLLKYYLFAIVHVMLFPIDNRFKKQRKTFEQIDKSLFDIHYELRSKLDLIGFSANDRELILAAESIYKQKMIRWVSENNIAMPNPIEMQEIINMQE